MKTSTTPTTILPQLNNPRVGELIHNLGGGATVKRVISDTLVVADIYGMEMTVPIIGRTPNCMGSFNQLTTN